jgi:hypothetical protein
MSIGPVTGAPTSPPKKLSTAGEASISCSPHVAHSPTICTPVRICVPVLTITELKLSVILKAAVYDVYAQKITAPPLPKLRGEHELFPTCLYGSSGLIVHQPALHADAQYRRHLDS